MTLETAIASFCQFLASERNMAPRTVEAYRYDLTRFQAHLSGKAKDSRPVNLVDADNYDLKDYLATLKEERDCKAATLARVVSSLRMFYRYCVSQGFLDDNPAAGLRSPKKSKKLPIFLTHIEAEEILDGTPDSDAMRERDLTMILLLVMTGIRVSELVGIDLDSIDWDNGTIRVLGKGRKERLVPMNRSVREALGRWKAARPVGSGGCRALFLDRHGRRITPRMVQYAVRKAVKACGLDPRVSPHKLRHTFATNLYAEDTDLRDIQELLGHANIASTSIYTHTNVDKVRAAVNRLTVTDSE